MTLTPITRRLAVLPVSAVDADGNEALLAGIDVAVLGEHDRPTSATAWTPTTFANGEGTFLICGYDAAEDGALVVPQGGGWLWARVTENPEVEAVRVEKLTYNL